MILYFFLIWASDSGGDVLKISYLELWWPSFSVERNHLCNFERGYIHVKVIEIWTNVLGGDVF